MNILHTKSQLAYTIDDKLILSKQVQEYFDRGHRAECLSVLWKCYQIAPYFLPIQPFIRHFKKELSVLEKLYKNFCD